MITRFKKFGEKIVGYLKELGKLTPIAFLTAVLPIIGGTILLIVALPLGHWLRTNWEIGAILFYFGIVVCCGLALLATNIIGLISGWAFGFPLGLAILIAGIVSAATISYLIHTGIAGETLPHVFEKHPKAKVVYEAIVEKSFWRTTLIIFLLRLSPAMPFALTNFLLGAARVPLNSFIIGTFLGMLPRSTAVVFVGSGLSELTFDEPQEAWLIVFGIIATIISIIFISLIARRALSKIIDEQSAST